MKKTITNKIRTDEIRERMLFAARSNIEDIMVLVTIAKKLYIKKYSELL